MDKAAFLASRDVDLEWISNLEVLDVNQYGLPGATVKRNGPPDPRLVLMNAKHGDLVTFYEHVASVRHKPTMAIYVFTHETGDALLRRFSDPVLYPAAVMRNPLKQMDRATRILRAYANPKPLIQSLGTSEEWWPQWLREIPDDRVWQSLAYYANENKLVKPESLAR